MSLTNDFGIENRTNIATPTAPLKSSPLALQQPTAADIVITIDGSYGEGGGQIVRNACAYTALLLLSDVDDDKPRNERPMIMLHLTNIRSKRPRPGLQRQHLVGIEMLAELLSSIFMNQSQVSSCCPIVLKGGYVKSQEVWFGIRSSLSQEIDGDDKKYGTRQIQSESNIFGHKRPRDNSIDRAASLNVQPSSLLRRQFVGDTGTAGSICLLIQATLPFVLLHKNSHLSMTQEIESGNSCGTECAKEEAFAAAEEIEMIFRGGTNATLAPQLDYFDRVFLPTLKQQCDVDDCLISTQVIRRGFYPQGGGEVRIIVRPCRTTLKPIVMKKRGEIVEITIRSFSGGTCPKSVAVSMANGAEAYLKEYYYNMKPQNCGIASSTIRVEEFRDGDIMGSGSGIMIVATTSNGYRLAGSAVGSHKVSPKVSGRQAAVELVNCLSQSYRTNDHEVYYPCVDEYLQDQLILYMALADGVSEIICGSLSLHTQTAISLAEKIFSVHRKVKKKTSDHGEDRTGSSDCQQSPLFEVIRLDGKEENQVPPDDMGYLPGLHLIRCHGIGYGK